MNMKKIIALILALVCVMSVFAGCDDNNNSENPDVTTENKTESGTVDESESDSEKESETEITTTGISMVEKFINYINSGEYLNAIDCYNDELYGNYTFELEVNDEIISLLNCLNNDILQGQKTSSDSKKVISVIDKVISKTNLHIDNYEEIKENIEISVASKAAFLAGKELEELKNYADAIVEYKGVIEADSNYNDAQTAIERCVTTLKENVFDKVKTLIEKNEFIEAISQLKSLIEKLPDDDDVIAKLSVCEKTYISNTIQAAEEEFVTPSTDYLKCLDIINGALQYYPGNEELLSKKDYYNSFAPTNLASLSKYDTSGTYGPTFLASEEDTLGNLHTDVFRTWSYMYESAYVVYILNGNYNKLTFTVYGRLPSDTNVAAVTVRDYSQGEYDLSTVLYKNETVKRGAFPFEVEIDVTGVQMIRIYVEHGVAVADAVVQRTVK